jgi:hypothetical protein
MLDEVMYVLMCDVVTLARIIEGAIVAVLEPYIR